MQVINKCNIRTRFLVCVIGIFSKYVWVIPLKNNKGITITNVFKKLLDESDRKPNKISVDKGSEFYNRSMKSWLEKNEMKMYSIPRKGKYVVAERIKFINI